MLRTLFFHAAFIPWTLAVLLLGIPLSLIHPPALHRFSRVWARIALLLAGSRVIVEGKPAAPPWHAVIYMPNHQSAFDIPALLLALPVQCSWVAKKELFRIPLFGLAMRRARCICIDREDRTAAIHTLERNVGRVATGVSVLIFPEGTRSRDGRLLPFRKGGFTLALQSQAPVVPVAITGSREIKAKGVWRIRPGVIRVRILPPIPTAGRQLEEHPALMDEVRRALVQAVETAPEK